MWYENIISKYSELANIEKNCILMVKYNQQKYKIVCLFFHKKMTKF